MILSKLHPSPVPSKIHFNAMLQPASWFFKWTFLHHDSAYITCLFILAASPAHRDLMDYTILWYETYIVKNFLQGPLTPFDPILCELIFPSLWMTWFIVVHFDGVRLCLHCGHQQAYCSSSRWYVSMVEWYWQGETEERPVIVPDFLLSFVVYCPPWISPYHH
jgi:hypothetical protein